MWTLQTSVGSLELVKQVHPGHGWPWKYSSQTFPQFSTHPIFCPRNYSWSPVREFLRFLGITKDWLNWVQIHPGLKTHLDIARLQSLSKATLRSGQSRDVQRCFKVLKTRVRLFKKKSQKTQTIIFVYYPGWLCRKVPPLKKTQSKIHQHQI